eukprot:11887557-Alexandrium_andersonii.AAC.1
MWQDTRGKLRSVCKWSPWQAGTFTYAGIRICQLANYSIAPDQAQYSAGIESTTVSQDRPQSELSADRGVLMKCQWRATQTVPQHAAR